MIYRDTEDLYFTMPHMAASILVKSIIQSVVSMKLDNHSNDESVQSAEFSLIQFANMINSASPFKTEEQRVSMYKLFSPYYGEKDNSRPEPPPEKDKDDEIRTFEEDEGTEFHALFNAVGERC